jgi:flavin-dependent dehydrogenase
MSKRAIEPDVLIVGDHPSAHLAAALLREKSTVRRIVHIPAPGESHSDRLVVINPAFFDLHKFVGPLKRKLQLTPIYGLRFLADEAGVRGEWTSRSIVAYVAHFKPLHVAVGQIARDAGVEFAQPDTFHIRKLDEQGVVVEIDGKVIRARLILLAGHLPLPHKKMLGLPHAWDDAVLHRYTFIKLTGVKASAAPSRATMSMSLDLRGTLWWAWLLPGPSGAQLAVAQPASAVESVNPVALLRHWADVLTRHDELKIPPNAIDFDAAEAVDLPLAGALTHEGFANRTLLMGPAGGFYSACGEDIYPNCWSAVIAADAAKKALQERHVQDALHTYRQKWGATLGDFLRGPQQNLRFLLPLVYRNPMMTARLAEAILLGKSVVR